MCGGLSAGDHETRQAAQEYTSRPYWDGRGRKYLGDTSNVLCPGGRGTDCKGQAGLEKCDPGSPLEEAVNDQDGATVGERGVEGRRLAPGSSSKRKRNEMRSDNPAGTA